MADKEPAPTLSTYEEFKSKHPELLACEERALALEEENAVLREELKYSSNSAEERDILRALYSRLYGGGHPGGLDD